MEELLHSPRIGKPRLEGQERSQRRKAIVTIDNLDAKIRYFLRAAEHASLSQAACEIGISQSALSRQLVALESYMGKPLFARTGHGIKLTGAGEKLRKEAQTRYEEIDSAITFIRDKEGVTSGKLRIATTYTIGMGFVSDLLDAFISRQAGISLSITSGGSPYVLELVEKKQADIGFLYDSAVVSDQVESAPLFDSHMCIIAQRGTLDARAKLDLLAHRHPLVSYPKNYALREMLRSANLDDRIAAEANTLEVILQLVASGVGWSILPDRIPARMLNEYGLIKIPHTLPPLKRRVVTIVRSGTATPLARSLFDAARGLSKLSD